MIDKVIDFSSILCIVFGVYYGTEENSYDFLKYLIKTT